MYNGTIPGPIWFWCRKRSEISPYCIFVKTTKEKRKQNATDLKWSIYLMLHDVFISVTGTKRTWFNWNRAFIIMYYSFPLSCLLTVESTSIYSVVAQCHAIFVTTPLLYVFKNCQRKLTLCFPPLSRAFYSIDSLISQFYCRQAAFYLYREKVWG